jgi:hypothetical protein
MRGRPRNPRRSQLIAVPSARRHAAIKKVSNPRCAFASIVVPHRLEAAGRRVFTHGVMRTFARPSQTDRTPRARRE